MKINPIYNFKPAFTAYKPQFDDFEDDFDTRNMAESDYYGANIRNYLRAKIYSQIMPTSEFDDGFYNYLPEIIDDVYIPNCQKLGERMYRGSSLSKNLQFVPLLPKSGVSTVIDLQGFDALKEACKENHVDYFHYKVDFDYFDNPIFKTEKDIQENFNNNSYNKGLSAVKYNEELEKNNIYVENKRRKFVEDFTELINVINDGGFYIGCEFGEMRTSNILALNSYFNPKWSGKITHPQNEFVLKSMRNMYNNLSDIDKVHLGFTEEFETELKEKLGIEKDGE